MVLIRELKLSVIGGMTKVSEHDVVERRNTGRAVDERSGGDGV